MSESNLVTSVFSEKIVIHMTTSSKVTIQNTEMIIDNILQPTAPQIAAHIFSSDTSSLSPGIIGSFSYIRLIHGIVVHNCMYSYYIYVTLTEHIISLFIVYVCICML